MAAGLIQTEGMLQYGGQELVDEYAKTVPMARAGRAEEVAATIAFLASDGGAYVTGSTVTVDGGADAWGMCAAAAPRVMRYLTPVGSGGRRTPIVIPTVANTITPIAARRSTVSAIHPSSSGDQTKP